MNWKIPSVENLIGQLNMASDRQAMGLPDHRYVPFHFDHLQDEIKESLPGISTDNLIKVLEDPAISIRRRLAAGQLLALIGDPRIEVLQPVMCCIPSGDVQIGTKNSNIEKICRDLHYAGLLPEWIEKECPQFHIFINEFLIGKYPVTNSEYHQFLLENPDAEMPSSWVFGRYPFAKANHPVHTLTVQAAEQYVAWLNQKTARRFRLPTEFEWEYAAAGAAGRSFPWGNQFIADYANTLEFGLGDTSPVGAFAAGNSEFGVCDMAGNVEEFTSSNYAPYSEAIRVKDDDLKNVLGEYRVARGGSFTRFADLARCQRRHGHYPKSIYVMGFRLAEVLVPGRNGT